MLRKHRPSPLLGALLSTLLCACNEGERNGSAGSVVDAAEADAAKVDAEAEAKADALPDAKALLAESVEALGGAANFEAIRSYHIVSKMTDDGLGLNGVADTWWRDGDFYVESDIPGVGKMRLGSQGGKVWSDDPINGPRAIFGVEAEQSAWSTSRCIAHDWRNYFKSAETTELLEVDGSTIAVITLTSMSGDEVKLNIDMATKMPVSQSFKQANPLGAMPVTVTFADYRTVHGTQVAFRQLVDATLTKMTSETESFDVNVEIPDGLFAPPGPEAVHLPDGAGEKPPGSPVADSALVDAAKE